MTKRCAPALLVFVFLPCAYAQETSRYFRATDIEVDYRAVRDARIAMPLNWQQPPPGRPQRSIKRKVLGAVVGGVGGFFVGGFLGAKIDGDCDCDDPGFVGALIGAPVGAAAGSILGYKFLF